MKLSDEEYIVLSTIAFGQCIRKCSECKYYCPESKNGCFAIDVLDFILFAVREDEE